MLIICSQPQGSFRVNLVATDNAVYITTLFGLRIASHFILYSP